MATATYPIVETHAVSAPAPPRGKSFYRPELDLLRCFAFLAVLMHHSLPLPFDYTGRFPLLNTTLQQAGACGVCLFFTLSAFLITELLLREREKTGTVHIGAFYARRILRIWPLYFLALFLALVLPHAVTRVSHLLPHMNHPFATIGALLPMYLLFAGNWPIVLAGKWFLNPMLGPLWSVSIEEQFYLLFPTLVKRTALRVIVFVSLAILPMAWATDYLLAAHHANVGSTIWCNTFSQFGFFALGTLLAIALHGRQLRFPFPVRLLLIAAGCGACLLAATPFHFLAEDVPVSGASELAGYLCIELACVLLFLGMLGMPIRRPWQPFVYLGKISYGLYVFHLTVGSFVGVLATKVLHLTGLVSSATTFALTLAATIPIAAASYHFYEKPFLRLKERFTFVKSRPA